MMKLTKLGGNEKLQYSSVLDLVFTKYWTYIGDSQTLVSNSVTCRA